MKSHHGKIKYENIGMIGNLFTDVLLFSKTIFIQYEYDAFCYTFQIQPNSYAIFYDHINQLWSVKFETEVQLTQFSKQVSSYFYLIFMKPG